MKNKKNKYVILAIIILIAIICISITINKNNNKNSTYNIDKFEHRDISKLSFVQAEFRYFKNGHKKDIVKGYVYMPEDYESVMDTKDNYYAAKIPFTNEMTIIEENVIDYDYDGGFEGPIVKSVLYSKQKLNKGYVSSYINEIHDEDRCGTDLKEFKNIEKNYYYIKYQIPEEC